MLGCSQRCLPHQAQAVSRSRSKKRSTNWICWKSRYLWGDISYMMSLVMLMNRLINYAEAKVKAILAACWVASQVSGFLCDVFFWAYMLPYSLQFHLDLSCLKSVSSTVWSHAVAYVKLCRSAHVFEFRACTSGSPVAQLHSLLPVHHSGVFYLMSFPIMWSLAYPHLGAGGRAWCTATEWCARTP